jgi:hypothetical protein
MTHKMPESIRTRKLKTGFTVPLVDWFNGDLKAYVLDKTHAKTFVDSESWDGKRLQEWVLERYETNSWNWADCSFVWSCISADIVSH